MIAQTEQEAGSAEGLSRYREGLITLRNAMDTSQPFGKRAKQVMSAPVFGKDVELRFRTVDRYGRVVALVFVDGRDAGLELIKRG